MSWSLEINNLTKSSNINQNNKDKIKKDQRKIGADLEFQLLVYANQIIIVQILYILRNLLNSNEYLPRKN